MPARARAHRCAALPGALPLLLTQLERDGDPLKNPKKTMADPVAIMGVAGILFPFVLLGILVAAGVIDVSVYKG